MKTQKKPVSINFPIWMDMAIRELAQTHKRSFSSEIEFLIEETIKNDANLAQFVPQEGGNPPPAAQRDMKKDAV